MKNEIKRFNTIYRALNSFHKKKVICNYLPQITNIELTTRCNLNCVFCPRKVIGEYRGFGDMPFNCYKDIIENYPDSCRNLRLFHLGEPTLYPSIVDAVQFASEKSYVKSVGFSTNGNFPTSMLEELFEAGITIIQFSFEGTSKEVYENIRQGGNFELVVENIKEACRLKEKYPNVIVRTNTVKNSLTEKDLDDFIKYWSDYPLTIDIAPLHNWAGNVEVNEDYMRNFLPQSCFNPWFVSIIHYNGNVVSCCYWITQEPMGNIFKEKLQDIWNGQRLQKLRSELIKGRQYCSFCKNCFMRPMGKTPFQLSERNPFFPLDLNFCRIMREAIERRLSKREPKIRRVKH